MKRAFYYLAPLNCIAYVIVLWAIVLICMRKPADTEGWGVVVALAMLVYAVIITLLSLFTMLIKDKRIWWWTQTLLSAFVIGSIVYSFFL